jgi:hypothetical protein
LFLKEGAAEIAAWGGEFEFLVVIVNLVQQGHWSFRYYEERVTEEEVSPRAGQRRGKLAL